MSTPLRRREPSFNNNTNTNINSSINSSPYIHTQSNSHSLLTSNLTTTSSIHPPSIDITITHNNSSNTQSVIDVDDDLENHEESAQFVWMLRVSAATDSLGEYICVYAK